MKYFGLALRILAAGILFQTLFFKFTGAPESRLIFSQLGAEPLGRWLAGCAELLAGTLLLLPATQLAGAGLGILIMAGAIGSHFAVLGIQVNGDGGLLFSLACIVMAACLIVAWINRTTISFTKGPTDGSLAPQQK